MISSTGDHESVFVTFFKRGVRIKKKIKNVLQATVIYRKKNNGKNATVALCMLVIIIPSDFTEGLYLRVSRVHNTLVWKIDR